MSELFKALDVIAVVTLFFAAIGALAKAPKAPVTHSVTTLLIIAALAAAALTQGCASTPGKLVETPEPEKYTSEGLCAALLVLFCQRSDECGYEKYEVCMVNLPVCDGMTGITEEEAIGCAQRLSSMACDYSGPTPECEGLADAAPSPQPESRDL